MRRHQLGRKANIGFLGNRLALLGGRSFGAIAAFGGGQSRVRSMPLGREPDSRLPTRASGIGLERRLAAGELDSCRGIGHWSAE